MKKANVTYSVIYLIQWRNLSEILKNFKIWVFVCDTACFQNWAFLVKQLINMEKLIQNSVNISIATTMTAIATLNFFITARLIELNLSKQPKLLPERNASYYIPFAECILLLDFYFQFQHDKRVGIENWRVCKLQLELCLCILPYLEAISIHPIPNSCSSPRLLFLRSKYRST